VRKVYKGVCACICMKKIEVPFEFIVENCKTISDLRELDRQVRRENEEEM